MSSSSAKFESFAAGGADEVDADTCWRVYPHGRAIPPYVVATRLVPKWKHPHNDSCEKCGRIGELLVCDYCNLSFHLECFTPPMPRVPSGKWACPECAVQWDTLLKANGIDEEQLRKKAEGEKSGKEKGKQSGGEESDVAPRKELAKAEAHASKAKPSQKAARVEAHVSSADESDEYRPKAGGKRRREAEPGPPRWIEGRPAAGKTDKRDDAGAGARRPPTHAHVNADAPVYAEPARRVLPSISADLISAARPAPAGVDTGHVEQGIDDASRVETGASEPAPQTESFEEALRKRARQQAEQAPAGQVDRPRMTSAAPVKVVARPAQSEPAVKSQSLSSLLFDGLDVGPARVQHTSARTPGASTLPSAIRAGPASVAASAVAPALPAALTGVSAPVPPTQLAQQAAISVIAPATVDPRRRVEAVLAASAAAAQSVPASKLPDAPAIIPIASGGGLVDVHAPSLAAAVAGQQDALVAAAQPAPAPAPPIVDVARDPRRARMLA